MSISRLLKQTTAMATVVFTAVSLSVFSTTASAAQSDEKRVSDIKKQLEAFAQKIEAAEAQEKAAANHKAQAKSKKKT